MDGLVMQIDSRNLLIDPDKSQGSSETIRGSQERLSTFLQRSFETDEAQHKKWLDWFELNMPLCYIERVCRSESLRRVHLRALASFCGPENSDTTTVVRHREDDGFIVSVLETESSPGTLLNIIRNTLPQAQAALYCIDVFTSLDDSVGLSVYHYCHDRSKLRGPSAEDKQHIFEFAEEVQNEKHAPSIPATQDFSHRELDAWLQGCPGYYIRCTQPRRVFNMFRYCNMARVTQSAVVEWELDQADDMKYDLPIRDCGVDSSTVIREKKKEKLAASFWVCGCIPRLPVIPVMEMACSVLLNLKLNIERAHADTVWDNHATQYVLVCFFVFSHEDNAEDLADTARLAAATLRRAAFFAMGAADDTQRPTAGPGGPVRGASAGALIGAGARSGVSPVCDPVSPRSSNGSDDLSSLSSVEGISLRQNVTISGFLQVLCPSLCKVLGISSSTIWMLRAKLAIWEHWAKFSSSPVWDFLT